MDKLNDVLEVIGQCLFEEDIEDGELKELTKKFLNLSCNSYVVVAWPESQELMDKEWFDEEAVLDVDGKFGSSAYFIPLHRVL